jgi:hypothetical protein
MLLSVNRNANLTVDPGHPQPPLFRQRGCSRATTTKARYRLRAGMHTHKEFKTMVAAAAATDPTPDEVVEIRNRIARAAEAWAGGPCSC